MIASAIAQSATCVLHQVAEHQHVVAVGFERLHGGQHFVTGTRCGGKPTAGNDAVRNVNKAKADCLFWRAARTGEGGDHGIKERQRERSTDSS